MKPFDAYPDDRVNPLPMRHGVNTRRIDAPLLQRLTNQTTCAYCGIDLVSEFTRWLLTSIDHVVPTSQATRLGISEEFSESMSNLVLCCSGCSGFDNRYELSAERPRKRWTFKAFCDLRDRVFLERKMRIVNRRAGEIEFFNTRPWHPSKSLGRSLSRAQRKE
jgi:5-methylcytosine-specific restriction endonuclease McrA